ncbi:hypothetical protein DAETH_32770 (plasmid) [Deinococcus aetherius]|uniref:DUF1211 domain-containing protein n=1 Tax=Deinococcus aetherius TaxID=200252 RepID=A0ABM8AHR5_9DEIO|nr:TMEM175 family protein [Deinococcus aetherius]BDP43308.1 hypothetical protein DAETH_32770 [Deinococcus aetherius]
MALPLSSASRLEFFSDGVFAIVITLLVLEIRAPQIGEHARPAALWAGLGALWPSYLAYTLTFSTILVAWIGHNLVMAQVGQVSLRVMLVNGLFLLNISFLPFPTSVVAEYLRSESASAAAAFYALANLFAALTHRGLVQAVLAEYPQGAAALLDIRVKSAWSIPWCLACAALALLSPLVSFVSVAAMWVWLALPQFGHPVRERTGP